MAHGGKREGAGRKPKADEQKLIERLTPLEDKAYKALETALLNDEGWAVKLFMEYRYGKPKQSIQQETTHNFNDFDITKLYDRKA